MSRTKIVSFVMIPLVAFLLFSRSLQPVATEAKPTAVVTLTNTLCITMSIDGWASSADALSACNTLNDPDKLGDLVEVLGGDRDDPQPEDFADIDLDGGQMHEQDGVMFVLAFVSDDDSVGFAADEGAFESSGSNSAICGPFVPPADFTDADCDDNGTPGDGVVVAKLLPADGDRGPAELRVRQGMLESVEPYTIVGEPHDIELSVNKTTIQTGAAQCVLFDDTASFLAALAAAETTPVSALVTDEDGTAVTGALVVFEVETADGAMTALPLVPSVASPLGVAAPNVLCGGEEPGTITLTARLVTGEEDIGVGLDPGARERDDEVEVTVVGPPAEMVLSAAPASLVCDGTATSTITATLTDDEGNPAVDGNIVEFESRALGTVSPREAMSAGGTATTVLTPLSSIGRGVVVRATLMLPELEANDPEDLEDDETILVPAIEKTILVECTEAAPPAPAPGPPAPAPAPVIQPPPTGSGGYLP